ncbi:MAG: hypothetical protein BGO06_20250 [Shinella sp. 65-6]|nr:MAG: hypothetical protein BGO06_20250 [Shinella sp. 65-6]
MEHLFHGDRLRVELMPEGTARPIFAELPRTAVPAELAPGDRVTIGIDPADVLVFDAEGGR